MCLSLSVLQGTNSNIPYDDSIFLSRVFTVRKPNGDNSMPIDLYFLNTFVRKSWFCMESFETINIVISKKIAYIDLSNAFYSFPLHHDSRRFTAFVCDNQEFVFIVLLFGLTASPRIFSKILRPVLVHVRFICVSNSAY